MPIAAALLRPDTLTPAFEIVVGGKDYTAAVTERLIELRLVDAAGYKSDYLELVLDDRTPLPRPTHGARLDVRIGYKEQGLHFKGTYVHDETEFSGPPKTMSLRAASVNFRDDFNAPRSRSFDNVTIGDLVRGIAGEHSYETRIDPSLDGRKIAHLDQTAESDLRLLTRVAQKHGALFKAAGNTLLMIPKTNKDEAIKQALGVVVIQPSDLSDWRITRQDKSRFNSVRAVWWDPNDAELKNVTTEGGRPVYEIQEQYPSEDEANSAAKAKFEELNKQNLTASLTLPGNPKLVAEAGLILEGFRDGIDGEYTITRVEHSFTKNGGYQCKVDAELPKAEDAAEN